MATATERYDDAKRALAARDAVLLAMHDLVYAAEQADNAGQLAPTREVSPYSDGWTVEPKQERFDVV